MVLIHRRELAKVTILDLQKRIEEKPRRFAPTFSILFKPILFCFCLRLVVVSTGLGK